MRVYNDHNTCFGSLNEGKAGGEVATWWESESLEKLGQAAPFESCGRILIPQPGRARNLRVSVTPRHPVSPFSFFSRIV